MRCLKHAIIDLMSDVNNICINEEKFGLEGNNGEPTLLLASALLSASVILAIPHVPRHAIDIVSSNSNLFAAKCHFIIHQEQNDRTETILFILMRNKMTLAGRTNVPVTRAQKKNERAERYILHFSYDKRKIIEAHIVRGVFV